MTGCLLCCDADGDDRFDYCRGCGRKAAWFAAASGNTPQAAKTGRDPSSTPDAELGPYG
jgi:hypothetical protein